MKILHVIANLDPKKGGPPKAVIEMCEALVKEGHETNIYTTDEYFMRENGKEFGQSPQFYNGVKIYYFPYYKELNWYFSPQMGKFIKESIKKFDVVHIHSIFLYHTMITAYYCRKYNIPYIIRPHGSLDPFLRQKGKLKKYIYHKLIEDKNINKAAFVHYTAEDEKKLAHDELGFTSKPFIASLGINLDEFGVVRPKNELRNKYPYLKDKFVFLFLGRIHPKKGLDILIKAFSKISERYGDTHLLIVGPNQDNYQKQVEQWILENEINDKVTLLGMLTGRDKAEVYALSDVFVLPSYTENFGITVVEAMISGLPIIISENVNIYNTIKEEEAGFIIKCDISQTIEAMSLLYSNEDLRDRLRKNALNLVKSTYSWNVAIKNINSMYEQAISGKS